MPFTREFKTAKIACLTSDGDVGLEDVKSAAQELYEDPRFTAPTRLIWDLRPGRGTLDKTAVAKLVDFFVAHRPAIRGRTVILVADDLTFGLSRMFEELAGGDLPVETRISRDYDAAIAWLSEDEASWGPGSATADRQVPGKSSEESTGPS